MPDHASAITRSHRRPSLEHAIVLALAVLALHGNLLLGRVHERGEDDLELTIPYNVAFWRAIEHGESPWWIPWIDGGTSSFARFPYLGPFYPAALLFEALPPVRAVEIALFAHVLLAAFGVRAWARALGASQGGALLAALVFAGSSVWRVADREGYATEAPVWTWLPWALAALEGARDGNAVRHGALAGLAVGLLALGGHATDLYVGALATTIYLGVRLATVRKPDAARRMGGAAGIAALLGAAIAAAFWLPVLRTVDFATFEGARAAKPGLAHPLLRLFEPLAGWGTKDSLFLGIASLAWMAVASVGPCARRAVPLATAAGLALALAFGPGSLPWHALDWLPGFGHLDQGNVFSWPFALFAAVLVGLGFDGAASLPPSRPRGLGSVALAVVLLCFMLWCYPKLAFAAVWAGLLIVVFGWEGLRRGRNLRAPSARSFLVAFTVLELALYALPAYQSSASHLRSSSTVPPDWWTRTIVNGGDLAAGLRCADGVPCRVLPLDVTGTEAAMVLWRNESMLSEVEDVRASAHLGSPRHRRLVRAMGPWPVDWATFSDDRARAPREIALVEGAFATRVLDVLGVSVVMTDVAVTGHAFRARTSAEWPAWERIEPVARYRLVPHVTLASSSEEALARVLAPDFDPRAEVVLEEGLAGDEPPRYGSIGDRGPAADSDRLDAAERVRVARYRPGDIELEVDARDGERLVVGESWFPGWRATVDGNDAPIVRANYVHFALSPPAGRHRVRLTYRPPGLTVGIGLSATSFVVALGLLLRNRRSPPSLVTEP